MNVFQYSEIHKGTNGFVPKPVTGELMSDQTPHQNRIELMAERVERGEEIFDPSELRRVRGSTQGVKFLFQTLGHRGWRLCNLPIDPTQPR